MREATGEAGTQLRNSYLQDYWPDHMNKVNHTTSKLIQNRLQAGRRLANYSFDSFQSSDRPARKESGKTNKQLTTEGKSTNAKPREILVILSLMMRTAATGRGPQSACNTTNYCKSAPDNAWHSLDQKGRENASLKRVVLCC
jgi:hypothetical protein